MVELSDTSKSSETALHTAPLHHKVFPINLVDLADHELQFAAVTSTTDSGYELLQEV
jgi:hypothetical protein